jgi:hypothetical protein
MTKYHDVIYAISSYGAEESESVAGSFIHKEGEVSACECEVSACELDIRYPTVQAIYDAKHILERRPMMHTITLQARSAWTCIFSSLPAWILPGQPNHLCNDDMRQPAWLECPFRKVHSILRWVGAVYTPHARPRMDSGGVECHPRKQPGP